jgi:hypothetical protein
VKLRSTNSISLCLNLALAGIAICLLRKPVSISPSESAAANAESTTAPEVASLPADSNPPTSVTYVTNRSGWSAVEAEDLEPLATNLRTAGCPEKTVRDIVVARARRGLDQLSRRAAPVLPFWTAGLRRAHAQQAAERTVVASRAKLLASVERALGREVYLEDGKLLEDYVEQAIMRFVSGPLSEEKFSRLAGLLVRQEAQVSEVRARTQGILLVKDEVELKNLGRQFHAELAVLLLPAELAEFTARPGILKLADKVRFDATDLSPAEIRTVALIRARFQNPTMGEWFEGDSLTDEQEAQAKQAVREFLGEARFAQLERAADGDFRTLFDVSRDHHLPRDAAVKAFELRQLTAQVVARLRADPSLTDADRQQQFSQIEVQVQEGVLKVLGADACAEYLNHGGAWLTNVSGL